MERGTQIGAYQVLELLGAGGMARVYLAQDSRLGRKVALKVLPHDAVQNPERVRRFEQEARAASALNHPNILTIYEIGDVDSTKYIATEFVEGVTLASLIAGRMALGRALDISLQAAAALATAHAAGIVHRDIKPENIMVRPDGLVKVLDFGLAKLSLTGLESLHGQQTLDVTMPGVVMGTLAYMSPEQLRAQEVDARTDIWSLGVVLYRMITGTDPFSAPTATDIMVATLERTPTPLRQLRRECPEELERIVSKMLAKDRDERYQTMKDVVIDMKRLKQRVEAEQGASESVLAASTGIHSPMRKLGGRLGLLLGAAVIAGLLVLGGALWLGRNGRSMQPSPIAQPNSAQPNSAPATTVQMPNRESNVPPAKPTDAQTGKNAVPAPPAGSVAVPAVPEINVPAAAGERRLSYYFLVQKMRNGKPEGAPFRSTGKDALVSGGKFSIVVSSAERGSLYLVNQPEGGNASVLFPLPRINKGKSTLPLGQALEIGPYNVDATPGKEKLWIVWAASPVVELETDASLMANPQFTQVAGTQQLSAKIQRWLQQHQTAAGAVTTQASAKEVKIVSQSDPLVAAVELEHR
jgi:serine/threonine protein kinase